MDLSHMGFYATGVYPKLRLTEICLGLEFERAEKNRAHKSYVLLSSWLNIYIFFCL
jgi:hypothetical protein